MRILAIRGCNIASLQGEFDINLQQPPLSDLGLYSISGETGAGKSSILDTLCLALFDKIPRLGNTSQGVAIGAKDDDKKFYIKHNDVRSIMFRGAGEAYAEVEFKGNDQQVYRAKWRVQRARKSPSGRFQAQEMSCLNVKTKQYLGSKKTDIKHIIVDKLGLTFDQFKRSVLLAQGDFASFLKSPAAERSELLERMTGSQLYSQLSKAAYQEHQSQLTALHQLEQALNYQSPLNETERQDLLDQATQQNATLKTLQQQQQQTEKSMAWYQQNTQLQADLSHAEKINLKAREHDLAQAPQRELLAELSLAIPLIQQQKQLQQHQQAIHQTQEQEEKQQQSLSESHRSLEHIKQTKQTLIKDIQQQQATYAALQPDIAQAREIDFTLQQQTHALSQHKEQSEQQTLALAQFTSTLTQQTITLKNQASQHSQIEQWLTDHQDDQVLTHHWQQIEPQLTQYKDLFLQQIKNQARIQTQRQHREQKQQQLTTLQQTQSTAQDHLHDIEHSLLTDKTAWETWDNDKLNQQLTEYQQQLDVAQAAYQWKKTAESLQQADMDNQEKILHATTKQHSIQKDLEQLNTTLIEQHGRLKQAQVRHDSALLTEAELVQNLRSQLKSHQACPVCGSDDHPWKNLAQPMRQHIQLLKEELSHHQTQLFDTQTQQASKQAEVDLLKKQLTEYQLAVKTHNQHRNEHQNLMQDPIWNDVSLDHWHDKQQQVQHKLHALRAQKDQMEKSLTAYLKTQEIVDKHSKHLQQLNQQLQSSLASDHQLEKEIIDLTSQQQQRHKQLIEHIDRLSPTLTHLNDWQSKLEQTPESFIPQCLSLVTTFEAKQAQLIDLNNQQQTLQSEQQLLKQTQSHSQAELKKITDTLTDLQQQSDALQQTRANLLAGKKVTDIEQQHQTQLTQRNQQLDTLNQQQDSLQSDYASQDKQLATLKQQLNTLMHEASTLKTSWQADMTSSDLDLSRLSALSHYTNEWRAEQEKRQQDSRDKKNQAQIRYQERHSIWQTHQSQQPPEPSTQLLDQHTEQQQTIASSNDQLATINYQLKEDDQKRKAAKKHQKEINHQKTITDQWSAMNELIGSADGKKFRTFSQSLTLEVLLQHSNSHLTDLAPRYRLQRVPHTDLDLQIIDSDMGDEVRSVHSLSGGESFLVSLALALGLSSLTSDITQVESLFIDEGFGSLDSQTLDIALASLDNLQSTGRQIGIISHVPALVDQIGAQIQVKKMGNGASKITIHTG